MAKLRGAAVLLLWFLGRPSFVYNEVPETGK
jgi:hypothetical protein